MRSRGMVIGLIIAAGLVVIVGTGIFFFLNTPEASQQLPADSGTVTLSITRPENDTYENIGDVVSIDAIGSSEKPITTIQLSINGINVPKSRHSGQLPDGLFKTSWLWTPSEEGSYLLVARASTQDEDSSVSNAVTVNVTKKVPPLVDGDFAPPPPLVEKQAADLISRGSGEPALALQAPTPYPTPDSNVIDFSMKPTPLASDGEIASVGIGQSAKYMLILQGITSRIGAIARPTAAQITSRPRNCGAALVVSDQSDTEAGFFLYRLDPGSEFFRRVATLDGHPGKSSFEYEDLNLPTGNYGYYISAFNTAGETAGDSIFVPVKGENCPAQTVRPINLKELNINPRTAVDRMYCYMTTDGSIWTRVPAGQEAFVYPENGKYNFAPYLRNTLPTRPVSGKEVIRMDCWGWIGENLEGLGPGELKLENQDPGKGVDLGDQFEVPGPFDNDGLVTLPPPHVNETWKVDFSKLACSINLFSKKETCMPIEPYESYDAYVWIWKQVPDECATPLCNYAPADGFRLYTYCTYDENPKLVAEIQDPERRWLKNKNGMYNRWLTDTKCHLQVNFIRAYNNLYGESDNGWPAFSGGGVLSTHKVEPKSIEQFRFVTNINKADKSITYNNEETKRFNDAHPISGYLKTCNAADSYCRLSQDSAIIKFEVPVDITKMYGAQIEWDISSVSSYGYGSTLEKNDCNNKISVSFYEPKDDLYNADYKKFPGLSSFRIYDFGNGPFMGFGPTKNITVSIGEPAELHKQTDIPVDFCEVQLDSIKFVYFDYWD